MANYTTQLKSMIENNYNLGLDKYPIFDESYRQVLNQKIIDHYYFHEIGQETVGRFKFEINKKMNEIMPYYNKLYLSEKFEYDPLTNFKYNENWTKNTKGNSDTKVDLVNDGNSSSNISSNTTRETSNNENVTSMQDTNTVDVISNTPQDTVASSIDGNWNQHASNLEVQKGDQTGSNKTTSNGEDISDEFSQGKGTTHDESNSTTATNLTSTDDYIRHIEGNNGSKNYSQLLLDYRDTLLNIDMMVIEELHSCFMLVWD